MEQFKRWLEQRLNDEIYDKCIPNSEWLDYFLEHIQEYNEELILELLRKLLYEYSTGLDNSWREAYRDPKIVEQMNQLGMCSYKTEYTHRLAEDKSAWEGLSWTLEYVKERPSEAIKALSMCLSAEIGVMSDVRILGISQAIDIIEEKFINYVTNKEKVLYGLKSRQFEILINNLYKRMGYDVVLTPATRDGGKDIIAQKSVVSWNEKLYVECKLYKTTKLTKEKVNAFVGVISKDRSISRGIMFVTNKVSDVLKNAESHITILDINEIILLLNSYCGYQWEEKLNVLLRE